MTKPLAAAFTLIAAFLLPSPALSIGETCTPKIGWPDLPTELRSHIVSAVGGEVSPSDGPFNSTDVVRDSTPQSRFFGACRDGSEWRVAVERGGRGHHLQVLVFSGGALSDTWRSGIPSGAFDRAVLYRDNGR